MVQDTYLTLASASEGLYKEKGSKFISFAQPVSSEKDIKAKLEVIKKDYYDARHYCYAFILLPEEGREESYRANDDGEPAHSAGDPILGQIRSNELFDVLIVVIRYFGGTKLGVGGLVNAYKTSAAEAIAHNNIITKVIRQPLSVCFPYEATNEVMQLIHQYQVKITDQTFDTDCRYNLMVARSQRATLKKQFLQLKGVSIG